MSVTEFAKQLDDEEGTGIDTKMKYSTFYWKQNKYSRKIYHSASNLPELAINKGTTLFTWFTKKFTSSVNDSIDPTCCFSNHDLDHHCHATTDKESDNVASMFMESIIYNGEKLIYKNEGRNAIVKIIDSSVDSNGKLKYTVEFPSGESEQVTRENLARPDTPDIASIPTTIPDIQEAVQQLSDQDAESILRPNALSAAEQEFLDLHHRLFHLPFSVMFRLAKFGVLPKHFLQLKDRPPPCAACLFGTQHRTNWRS